MFLCLLFSIALLPAHSAAFRPVVLMHGLGASASDLSDLVASINTTYPGIHVVSASVDDGIFSDLVFIGDQVQTFARIGTHLLHIFQST